MPPLRNATIEDLNNIQKERARPASAQISGSKVQAEKAAIEAIIEELAFSVDMLNSELVALTVKLKPVLNGHEAGEDSPASPTMGYLGTSPVYERLHQLYLGNVAAKEHLTDLRLAVEV